MADFSEFWDWISRRMVARVHGSGPFTVYSDGVAMTIKSKSQMKRVAMLDPFAAAEELERLRTALKAAVEMAEFYGDEMIYVGQMAPGSPTGFTSQAEGDHGAIARAFLAEHRELVEGEK